MYQSLDRPATQTQNEQRPQSSYREQLRAQMRDNYTHNRTERASRASELGPPSRQEAIRYDTNYAPRIGAPQRGRFEATGPQVADVRGPRREQTGRNNEEVRRPTEYGQKTPSQTGSRKGRIY